MLLGMSTGEAIVSSISTRNCFWATNPVPVLRIFDRVWACTPRIAQTYVRIESLRCSTPTCVKPSDLSTTKVVQAPEISRLWRMASFGWKNGPCATCACLYAPDGVMKVLQEPRRLHSLAFTGDKWVAFADPSNKLVGSSTLKSRLHTSWLERSINFKRW